MFLTSLCRSLTLHQFETPPSRILDLGCGGGLWVIEAAKQWPVSLPLPVDQNAILEKKTSFDADSKLVYSLMLRQAR